jgi:hypothetical protein
MKPDRNLIKILSHTQEKTTAEQKINTKNLNGEKTSKQKNVFTIARTS